MTILERIRCRLGQSCPAPENDYDKDLRRIEEAAARIRMSIRETDIAIGYERARSDEELRRENDPPQGGC